MADNLTAALAYASQGWHVFPLKPRSKYPACSHGFKDATVDLGRITAYWQRVPNANIGVATGNVSRFFVVDIDTWDSEHNRPKQGLESWQKLCAAYGEVIPITKTQVTGSGGYQMCFTMPESENIRNSTSKLAPDVDVRGDGGYIVAAPSIHPNGRAYLWQGNFDISIAAAPAWLVELVTAKPAQIIIEPKLPAPPHDHYVGGILRKLQFAQKGERNNTLLWCACRMFDRGYDLTDGQAALLPLALGIGLTERETLATINSAWKQQRRNTSTQNRLPLRTRLRRMAIAQRFTNDRNF